jgi:hypothetical protein
VLAVYVVVLPGETIRCSFYAAPILLTDRIDII